MTAFERQEVLALNALDRLNLLASTLARINSVYSTKEKLGRLGITPELIAIADDNAQTDDEVRERIYRF